MMSYEDTINFLNSQSNVLIESAIENMVTLTAHIYDKDIFEVYRDIE